MRLGRTIRLLVRGRHRRFGTSGEGNYRTTALIVASALFMQQLDSTVLATALPTMARDFGVLPLHMGLALTAYLLGLSIFIPASGTFADRFGALKVFQVSIAVFVLGSILCGQSPNLPFLVASRFLQGIGGAMMIPVGRLLLLRSVSRKEMVSAMAWFTVPALVGPIVGPPLGGLIVTALSWHWIFYLNLPFGILGVLLAGRYLQDVREERPGRFDGKGFLLSGMALSGVMAGLELATRGDVPRSLSLSCFLAGLCAAAAYVWYARRCSDPILDLSLLRIPTFRLSLVGGSLTRITGGALPYLLPMMMQLGFGLSPARSGLVTFVAAAGSLLMKVVSAPVLRLLGFRTALVWNGILASLVLALCAAFRPDWPFVVIYGVLLAGGFLQSLQFTAYNTIAYADVPHARMSAATSLYTTVQQSMLSTGICLSSGALAVSTALGGRIRPSLADFSSAFLAVTAISIFASPVCARLPRGTGDDMSGHRTRRRIHPGHLEAP